MQYTSRGAFSVSLKSSKGTDINEAADNNKDGHAGDQQIFEDNIVDLASEQKDMMKELEWRSMKVTLEEANTRAFQKRLKSRPWKLPYDDAVSYIS